MGILVYYSTKSGNVHRFVERVGLPARRIPISNEEPMLAVDEDYILVAPTYGGGHARGAVPPQVKRFLNNPVNAAHLRGVIASGDRNYGAGFGLAGAIIARRFSVPHLYTFELFGTAEDIEQVKRGVSQFWTRTQPASPSVGSTMT